MKKSIIICAGLCALMFTGCKSQESAYKKAYEKARAQEQAANNGQQVVQQPTVVERPVTEVQTVDNYDNVNVRQENVTLISGTGLKGYSVVVGSFGLKTNAEGMQRKLRNSGYDAQIVFNPSNNMYRVVASTFDSKGDAVRSRDAIRSQYSDAWLLYKNY